MAKLMAEASNPPTWAERGLDLTRAGVDGRLTGESSQIVRRKKSDARDSADRLPTTRQGIDVEDPDVVRIVEAPSGCREAIGRRVEPEPQRLVIAGRRRRILGSRTIGPVDLDRRIRQRERLTDTQRVTVPRLEI